MLDSKQSCVIVVFESSDFLAKVFCKERANVEKYGQLRCLTDEMSVLDTRAALKWCNDLLACTNM